MALILWKCTWDISANKEKQLLEKEQKAKLQYEKQLEEKHRKLKEQKEKDERRRVSAEEKRKQKLAEDKVWTSESIHLVLALCVSEILFSPFLYLLAL